ncbi:MAG TPA: alpha/beta fold hydrolase [Polyangia bacterium]|nr:alpha/beta fold hydrolase [Polyangia bacterium]
MTAVPSWVDRAAYPFESRWLDLPAGRIHYVDEGRGPAILFVHGTPTWSFEWRHLVAGLRATHRCVAPDHLGFGLSARPSGAAYTPEAHAERLRDFVAKLGLERFTLVVHDFGGPIGLPLALGSGRVERLVVLNSWMWSFADDAEMTKRAKMVAGALGRFLYRRLNASLRMITPSAYGDRKKLTRAIHAQYLNVFPDADSRERVLYALALALTGSAAHYDGLWQRRAALAAIPSLVVWGLKDSAFRPRQLARGREALPHARVVELPGAGHWPQEEEPAAVLAALRDFVGGRD